MPEGMQGVATEWAGFSRPHNRVALCRLFLRSGVQGSVQARTVCQAHFDVPGRRKASYPKPLRQSRALGAERRTFRPTAGILRKSQKMTRPPVARVLQGMSYSACSKEGVRILLGRWLKMRQGIYSLIRMPSLISPFEDLRSGLRLSDSRLMGNISDIR
jgi:hypothetical protein